MTRTRTRTSAKTRIRREHEATSASRLSVGATVWPWHVVPLWLLWLLGLLWLLWVLWGLWELWVLWRLWRLLRQTTLPSTPRRSWVARVADDLRRIATSDDVRRNRFRHHTPRGDDAAIPDSYAWQDDAIGSDPDVVLDEYRFSRSGRVDAILHPIK